MKTRNIITIISAIFALVSCSAENDILNEMPTQNTEVSSIEATISCAINNVQTKAGEADGDNDINNVVYFLLDNKNEVLGYRTSNSASFQTKNQGGLKVLAVVNTKANITTLASKDAIMSQLLDETDLNALVKVGEAAVVFAGNTGTADITVNQVAARIDLSSLTLTITDADLVTLESVELKNRNLAGKMDGTTVALNASTVAKSTNQKMANGAVAANVCHFYSFANGSENATALVLHFDIDGKKVSKEVAIKVSNGGTNGVVSGANHQLAITATIQGENVTPVVSFTVADWNKSQISVDMND